MQFLHLLEKVMSSVFILLTTVALITSIYWLFLQDSTIMSEVDHTSNRILNAPMVNGISEVKAGSDIIVTRYYCLNQLGIEGKVNRKFTNHIIYNLPSGSTVGNQDKLGCFSKLIQVSVPAGLPSDIYTYEVSISYKLNPLKEVIYNLPPIKLKVVNPVYDAALKAEKDLEELKKELEKKGVVR